MLCFDLPEVVLNSLDVVGKLVEPSHTCGQQPCIAGTAGVVGGAESKIEAEESSLPTLASCGGGGCVLGSASNGASSATPVSSSAPSSASKIASPRTEEW